MVLRDRLPTVAHTKSKTSLSISTVYGRVCGAERGGRRALSAPHRERIVKTTATKLTELLEGFLVERS